MDIPPFRLSAGQVLWVLNRGRPPDSRLRNEVRYLRQLGIPHVEEDVGEGRGNRIYYGYEDLIELGVAIHAIRRGMKPKDAAEVLTEERTAFRKLFRDALRQQPAAGLKADWVKSRGAVIPGLANDFQLRLHDRYSTKPGTFELIKPDDRDITQVADLLGMRERFDDGETRVLVPLTNIALELTAWALEAPAIRPGRTARR